MGGKLFVGEATERDHGFSLNSKRLSSSGISNGLQSLANLLI